MDMGASEIVVSALAALLGGLNIFQFVFFKSTKKTHEAEAKKAEVSAKHDEIDLLQDQYSYVVEKLSNTQKDYYDLADKVREQTRVFTDEIDTKCKEIADLKSKVTYFKGLRCYKADCSQRIKTNPGRTDSNG